MRVCLFVARMACRMERPRPEEAPARATFTMVDWARGLRVGILGRYMKYG